MGSGAPSTRLPAGLADMENGSSLALSYADVIAHARLVRAEAKAMREQSRKMRELAARMVEANQIAARSRPAWIFRPGATASPADASSTTTSGCLDRVHGREQQRAVRRGRPMLLG